MNRYVLCIFFLISSLSFAQKTKEKEEIAVILTRSDAIPSESIEGVSDSYFEGYIQALVDMHYHEFRVVVIAKDHHIFLANLPKNKLIADSIIEFVKDVPGVKSVQRPKKNLLSKKDLQKRIEQIPKVSRIWFPQNTELFLPMVANPRQVTNSIGYRQGDKIIGPKKKAAPISLGDDFPILRWLDIYGHGDLQISIESGIWAVFDMDPPKPRINAGTALFNTDYYVGIPLTYAFDQWSFRLRLYHISSHLGDEFLVNNPGFSRANPSFEAVDFFTSYQAFKSLRLYGGIGAIVHSDPSFQMKPMYFEYGTEYRFLGTKFYKQRLYGTPFLAAHFRSYQYLNWGFDGTFMAGYEWSKLQGTGRKFRVFVEYHNGFSLEGQFMKQKNRLLGLPSFLWLLDDFPKLWINAGFYPKKVQEKVQPVCR